MAEKIIKRIIEALLFVSQKPLKGQEIGQAIDGMEEEKVREAIEELRQEYTKEERSFGIAELAGGYQIVTNPEFAPWIGKLFRRDEMRLSNPSLETLAIIAYKQPLTRSEIEKIRGVNVDGVLKTLLDKNLIKIRGRKDAPGRPIAYGTTEDFLERFGLKGLEQLPKLRDFSEHDLDFASENKKIEVSEVVKVAEVTAEETKGDKDALGQKET